MKKLVFASKLEDKPIIKNENISKFIQEHLENIVNSSKFRELVERVALQETLPKEKVMKNILERIADEANYMSKRKNMSNMHIIS